MPAPLLPVPAEGGLTAGFVIAPGVTVPLKFTATYNNDALGLAAGKKVHTELLVSFDRAAEPNKSLPW